MGGKLKLSAEERRLTAAKARELAGPSVSERVDAALELVRTAALGKKRNVALHDDLWVNGGYGQTKEWLEAKKQLEDLGYKVRFYYSEGSQFVDMYTVVEW